MKTRSIAYCQIKVLKNSIDQRNTSLFKKTLENLRELPDIKRSIDMADSNKIVGIEQLDIKNDGWIWIAFKTGRYGHTANLINRLDGSERINDKTLDEGEKELTHVCLKVCPNLAYCAVEGNRYGIGIQKIVGYLNEFIIKIDPEASLYCEYIVTKGMEDLITKSKRIIAVDVEVSHQKTDEDIFRKLYGPGAKQTYVCHFSAERKNSLSKDAVKSLFRSINPNGKVRRVKITLRNDKGNEMLLDSLMEKVRDRINVDFDENGVVISTDIFCKLQEYLTKVGEHHS